MTANVTARDSRDDRVIGSAVGDALGDALGAPFEFGPLAGAVHGVDGIPEEWRRAVFVPLPGFGDRPRAYDDLAELAKRLDTNRPL